ncbi:glycoside hydrolase family 76 protein [Cohnella silvisoli]|uniref:Glycoside hydrolase family 76 protein n=1 Tax=Cohnella silvisoli TaxID=2873699 RepID=A0ABV1KMG2_9BACL|nr:glycoside hydrolase family 76 protein [Cohnella silvisoli]MCD9020447.1 glycosyl hydrolase [Cohnella silvisoli]
MELAPDWNIRAETAQEELLYNFWNERQSIMNQCAPCEDGTCNDSFVYWWHAHVIDVLVDGYERTKKRSYLQKVDQVLAGVHQLNGGTLLHNFYDDMEWMALALLRVYDVTKNEDYMEKVLVLWENIQTAWNDHMGGGMAWRKDQLDYKNTPANAPAAILAARLYQRFGKRQDYDWAAKIYEWNKVNLVDPETGFVWDGMNRLGDGKIDYEWEYTYCQGVFIGAGIELYRITGNRKYLNDALRTTAESMKRLVPADGGVLPDEGKDDCGLFKGIYVRYLRQLLELCPDRLEVRRMIVHNASVLWNTGRDGKGLISRSWQAPVEPAVQLCAQLSGLMLIEMVASLPAHISSKEE